MKLLRSARWLMLSLLVSLIPLSAHAGIFISVNFGPPALPVYVQPPCPGADLVWTPGYWHYGEMGYYWVPGAWVPAPFVGGLWTPGYWGYVGGIYRFNPGYWGYHVGYYGGVNYGGGYLGIGFAGGEWRGGHLAYNTSVVNVNTTVIHNTYVNTTIVQQSTVANPNHVAYAGGPGGIQHTATPQEQVAAHETHTPPTSFQTQHQTSASTDKSSWAKTNGGHPTNVAVSKPLPVESHPAPPKTTTNSVAGKTTPSTGTGANKVALASGTPHTTTPSTTTHANVSRDSQSGLPTGKRLSTSSTPATNHSSLTQGTTAGSGGEAHTSQMRTVTPPKTTAPPPAHNSAPPKSSPPPSKPKPSGHEK
jgi:hypothetical protein